MPVPRFIFLQHFRGTTMKTMDINILRDLCERREKEKLIIDKELSHIRALIALCEDAQNDTGGKHKKINKGKVVNDACRDMIGEFCSNDIKEILNNYIDAEVRQITLSYISALLGKLSKAGVLVRSKRGLRVGSSNYYVVKPEGGINNAKEG